MQRIPSVRALVWMLLVLIGGRAGAGTPLTHGEQAVADAVTRQGEAPVALLERLVNLNSGTYSPASVHAVGTVLEQELRELGFRTRWLPMDAVGRAAHLVAEHDGRGPRVLLIGHMDTVFEPASGFTAFVRHGATATGPGVVDDKGGLVVMLSALKALQATGALAHRSISVFITADEESPGHPLTASRGDFIAAGRRADAALCFEAGARIDGRDYISTARRGATTWSLTVDARTGHSGGIFGPEVGDGALFELSRILARFHDELREPNMTFSAGLAAGGATASADASGSAAATGKVNVIPAAARAVGDLRTLTPEQLERVKERMRAIVASSLPGTRAQISFDDHMPPMAPTAGASALLERYSAASEALGLPPVEALDPMLRGAGDAAFISPYVSTLSGLGAVGSGSHTSTETVELALLPAQAQRAALMIYRLTQGASR